MGKIVYHGTFSDNPPHEFGEPFHAGTLNATDDRAADQIMGGEVKEPAIRQVHAYEISDDAPMSRRVWDDPMAGMFDSEGDKAKRVPEYNEKRIYPYKNIREDRGSISHVIPSGFVGQHVKHLGVQFQGLHASDEQYDATMDAITVMSGGKLR